MTTVDIIGITIIALALIALGETQILSDIGSGIAAAIRRHRERRAMERAYPSMWVEHLAALNKPAIHRKRMRIDINGLS